MKATTDDLGELELRCHSLPDQVRRHIYCDLVERAFLFYEFFHPLNYYRQFMSPSDQDKWNYCRGNVAQICKGFVVPRMQLSSDGQIGFKALDWNISMTDMMSDLKAQATHVCYESWFLLMKSSLDCMFGNFPKDVLLGMFTWCHFLGWDVGHIDEMRRRELAWMEARVEAWVNLSLITNRLWLGYEGDGGLCLPSCSEGISLYAHYLRW